MSIDITNHLIPYTQVKQMLATAWGEGCDAGYDYAMGTERGLGWPEPPINPYREDT